MEKTTRFIPKQWYDFNNLITTIMDNYNRLVEVLSTDEVESINKQWSIAPPLRIATVCSGTDAPILALEQLLSVLNKDKDEKIQMKHIFSCENSKFKRDFIEQTTNPNNLIFNDVVELSSGKGQCHDGKVRTVPDDFNVLIAGTECVDFSSLTTSPKTLKGGGRSDITFWATHKLAKKYQPSIVVLENVAKCPMNEMAKAFEDINYIATFRKVCTSEYLLPQSRSRIYFVFVHKDSAQFKSGCTKDDWVSKMEALGPNRQTNEKISWNDILLSEGTELSSKKSKKKGGRGKSLSESLSSKWLAEIVAIEKKEGLTPYDEDGGRPYTDTIKNIEVLAHLPDRAKMRLDVQFKRAVKAGVDPLKIPLIWNPAQQLRFTDSGVDSNGKAKTSIAPCVTPGHEWIVSSLKRPLSGEEALALQGIAIPKKALKQFECRQLRDLAGNAMSTTVVAAVFLSIFTTIELIDNGKKRSVSADDSSTEEQASKKQKAN